MSEHTPQIGAGADSDARANAKELKRLLVTLVCSVVALDGAIIGIYYVAHIADQSAKNQQTFVGVWVVLTLLVVATLMRRIRRAQRLVRGLPESRHHAP